MKRIKWLPVLALLLALAYFLIPGGNGGGALPAEPAQTAADRGGAELTLLTPTPEETETPVELPVELPDGPAAEPEALLDEDGSYDTPAEVALYVHTYGHLPANYITKKEAEAAGWSGGALDRVLPGMCIGGDRFGNYEGKLPKAPGRTWTECDLNTLGRSSRGAERLIFSNDGLIYYTPDHYESFELLYG